MNQLPILNPKNEWAKLPRWKKRVVGFSSYFLAAFCSIIEPEIVDWVLYNDLKNEFLPGERVGNESEKNNPTPEPICG